MGSNGFVEAMKNGTATIRATAEGVSGYCEILVDQEPIAVWITPNPVWLVAEGHPVELRAWPGDANGYLVPDASVTWAVADPSLVAFSPTDGGRAQLTPVANGTTTITVTADDVERSVPVTVSLVLRTEWVLQTEAPAMASAAIAADGTLYWRSQDGRLLALNPDGTLKWEHAAGGWTDSSASIGQDGTVYVGSTEGLYAINPNGTLKWEFVTGEGAVVTSSPAIGSDGTVYVGAMDDALWAIGADGTVKWRFAASADVFSSPAIGSDNTLYFGSEDGWFYAVNGDGSEKWSTDLGDHVLSSPAIASDGAVYIGSWGNTPGTHGLHSFNPDGTLRWTFAKDLCTRGSYVECGADGSSTAIGVDGTVYFAALDGSLLAINSDGTEKWRFPLDDGLGWPAGGWAASPAIGDDGTIYVGSPVGLLFAVNSDGTLKWSFFIGERYQAGVSTPPSIGSDGRIYFGDAASRFWAISHVFGGLTGLANSPWPKFRRDAQNTGNVSSDSGTPSNQIAYTHPSQLSRKEMR